jgi:hypothetical protein
VDSSALAAPVDIETVHENQATTDLEIINKIDSKGGA